MNQPDQFPEIFRNDIRIIRETAEQIIRDFQNDDIKIAFSGNDALAFDELKHQLIPFIHEVMNRPSAFHALLYRIDISESEYRAALSKAGSHREEIVAELIIRREFKKVLIRGYFRDNNRSNE